jgi:hypothetical protein
MCIRCACVCVCILSFLLLCFSIQLCTVLLSVLSNSVLAFCCLSYRYPVFVSLTLSNPVYPSLTLSNGYASERRHPAHPRGAVPPSRHQPHGPAVPDGRPGVQRPLRRAAAPRRPADVPGGARLGARVEGHRGVSRYADGWMDGWVDGWFDGWMDG